MPALDGSTLLIMGGTSTMAVTTAVAFAREGANIVITGRSEERNARAAQTVQQVGGACLTLVSDITDEKQVESAINTAVAEFGGITWAFNNAGIDQVPAKLPEISNEEFSRQFDVNVRGIFLAMKYEIPAILNCGGGAIINNASAAAHMGVPTHGIYSAAKAAVVSLTRSTALEYARTSLRINAISPASTDSEMFNAFCKNYPEAAAEAAKRHRMGRSGRAEEIANAVLFLCRDATYTTGHALPIDGGALT